MTIIHPGSINPMTVGTRGSPARGFSPIGSPPAGTGSYPNEPVGYNRLFEHNFEIIPDVGNGVMGTWTNESGPSNLSVVTGSNPDGNDIFDVQTEYPISHSSGNAPVHYNVNQVESGSRVTEQYFSWWLKVEGTDFENQQVGTKLCYFGYGESSAGALNQGYLIFVNSSGSQQLESNFYLDFWQQGTIGNDTGDEEKLGRNVGSGPQWTVGSYHQLEPLMIENTSGSYYPSADGTFKLWVDGNLTHNYTNIEWHEPSASLGFLGWKYDPVWGGVGGTKTRADYWRSAHVYMSGKVGTQLDGL